MKADPSSMISTVGYHLLLCSRAPPGAVTQLQLWSLSHGLRIRMLVTPSPSPPAESLKARSSDQTPSSGPLDLTMCHYRARYRPHRRCWFGQS